jgi:uncharacterized protein YlzI (FlbEa/FlbD family)
MIRVIRTDGVEILLNTDVIKTVEGSKDIPTVITLNSGEKITVKTPAYDVGQKIKAYTAGIRQERREMEKADKDKEKAKEKAKAKENEPEGAAEGEGAEVNGAQPPRSPRPPRQQRQQRSQRSPRQQKPQRQQRQQRSSRPPKFSKS